MSEFDRGWMAAVLLIVERLWEPSYCKALTELIQAKDTSDFAKGFLDALTDFVRYAEAYKWN